ncbi:MAG: AAA family ATPase [Acidimicrobiia bacterium]|nr:AAA family ATPase [Acidimicrobiia bacterium]
MLTKLTVRNFKRFADLDIELGSPLVFVGPNNSGKTSAMQALALWEVGVKRWNEKRAGGSAPARRPGVTVGRRDLVAVPVPHAKLLWHGQAVREQSRSQGRPSTSNV